MRVLNSEFVLPGNMLELLSEVSILLSHRCFFSRLDENSPYDGRSLHCIKYMNNEHRRCEQALTKYPALAVRVATDFSVRVIYQQRYYYLLHNVVKYQESEEFYESRSLRSKKWI